uniref:PGAP1-like alpha/beta domain-containing protein n=1 Tax=Vibrio vulnificus TaxID=672 RepID=UPI0019D4891D|nr:hypothetical protein [Vibrio vulnificus]
DFGDEISAASGALVEQQTEFVVDCVLEILSLYANKFIPRFPNARSRNVLLLGHSVGGLVATLAASHPRLMSRGSDSVPAVHS